MIVNCIVQFNTVICLATLLVLGGCFNRTQPTKFYLLHSLSNPQAVEIVVEKKDMRIGIGPIQLAEYLDRPQIVTRLSENEIQLDEFNQWAEPLKFSISRVLAENLSSLLNTDNIYIFPWRGYTQIDYQVKVDVIHFNGIPGDNAVLDVFLTISEGNTGRDVVEMKRSTFSQPTGEGYEALVSSMSRMIEDFSRETSEEIKAISQDE